MRTHSFSITDAHQPFLLEERKDPITGDDFIIGDKIVFCASCKSAFHVDSWDYLGKKHCDQRRTLPIFPKNKVLVFQKPIVLPFRDVDNGQRFWAYLLDCFIIVILGVVLMSVLRMSFAFELNLWWFIFFTLMFRDSILLNKSIGKKTGNMYFIDVLTQEQASFLQVLGRNMLFWAMNGIIYLISMTVQYFFIAQAHIQAQVFWQAKYPVFFILVCMVNVLYVLHTLVTSTTWFDKLLGIRLVQRRKDV